MHKLRKVLAMCLAITIMGVGLTGCKADEPIPETDKLNVEIETLTQMSKITETDVQIDWTKNTTAEENTENTETTTTVQEETTETTLPEITLSTTESETASADNNTPALATEATAGTAATTVTVSATTTTAVPVTTTAVQTVTEQQGSGVPISIVSLDKIMSTTENQGKAAIYKQLTEKERAMYDKLVTAVMNFQGVVDFGEAVSEEEYHKIFCIAFYQNPELFWWAGTLMQSEDGTQGILVYTYSQKQVTSYQSYIDKKTNTLFSKLTTDMTDLQKVLICHNWLVLNNEFSKENENSKNIYGSIGVGIAQCEGYAKGMLYLMNKIGIPTILSTGSNKEGNSHAWVKCYINGEWTNIDPTFDDTTMEPPIDHANISYRYMGVPDSAIYNVTHLDVNTSPIDHAIKLFDTPACTTYSLNADINYGNYATTYEEAFEILKADCFKSVEAGKRCAHVKVGTNEAYEETLTKLVTEKHIFDIRRAINEKYGDGTVTQFMVSPKNNLNYVEVTMIYGTPAN